MIVPDIDIDKTRSLGDVALMLQESYYKPLCTLCDEAGDIALQLRAREIDQPSVTEIYTVLCINFTKHLRQYQQQKIGSTIPYIFSLAEKQEEKHDCLNCNHNCQANHGLHVSFLIESHDFARTHLTRLNNVAVTPEGEPENAELYRQLRDKMYQIERYLLDNRFIEETVLIPGIQSAQKAINIRH